MESLVIEFAHLLLKSSDIESISFIWFIYFRNF